MDLLLINLPCKRNLKNGLEQKGMYSAPLGLMSIASYLEMHGFNVHLEDYNFEETNYNKINDVIVNTSPKVIGITAYTENCSEVMKIAKFIKHKNHNIYIVVGGPHVALDPNYFNKNKAIDFLVEGEGETPLLELLAFISGNHLNCINLIEGLSKNTKKEESIKNRIRNLDLLPMINRNFSRTNLIESQISVYSSKGCPAQCIYCSASAISGHSYRVRNAENIYLELFTLKYIFPEKNLVYVFIDDTMTALKKRIYSFFEIVAKYDFSFTFSCESRVDVVDYKLIDTLYLSGCRSIQFGLESGDQNILDNIKKNINIKHIKDIISYTAKYPDLTIFLSFMIGHYCDTAETMQKTIDFIKDAKKINKNIAYSHGVNTPFPGTYQYNHAKELGIHFLSRNYSEYDLITPVIYSDTYSLKDIIEANNNASKI